MIIARDPVENLPPTKATYLVHQIEKLDFFSLKWAHPNANPKLLGSVYSSDSLYPDTRETGHLAPKDPTLYAKPKSSDTSKLSDILRKNEIANKLSAYEQMAEAFRREYFDSL